MRRMLGERGGCGEIPLASVHCSTVMGKELWSVHTKLLSKCDTSSGTDGILLDVSASSGETRAEPVQTKDVIPLTESSISFDIKDIYQ